MLIACTIIIRRVTFLCQEKQEIFSHAIADNHLRKTVGVALRSARRMVDVHGTLLLFLATEK